MCQTIEFSLYAVCACHLKQLIDAEANSFHAISGNRTNLHRLLPPLQGQHPDPGSRRPSSSVRDRLDEPMSQLGRRPSQQR